MRWRWKRLEEKAQRWRNWDSCVWETGINVFQIGVIQGTRGETNENQDVGEASLWKPAWSPPHPFLSLSLLKTFYLFLAALGLCCCVWAFSTCGEWGPLCRVNALASHCGGFSCCRAQAWGLASFSSCSTWAQYLWHTGLVAPVACGIFLDQGSNPCPLHWQADSYPLCHWGSSFCPFLNFFPSMSCINC